MKLSDCSWSMSIAEIQAMLNIFVWHKSFIVWHSATPTKLDRTLISGSQSSGNTSPVRCFGNMLRHKGSS